VSFVLDNSVALAWCFEDEQTPDVMALLDRLTQTGARAPLLWPIEAQNGLLMAERRRRLDRPTRHRLVAFLHDLPIQIDEATIEQVWDVTADLAERFSLSMYDATYLELAQRRRLPLATLDRGLGKAAQALDIPTLGAGG
jgi:predicted nucleic acid-binding protein